MRGAHPGLVRSFPIVAAATAAGLFAALAAIAVFGTSHTGSQAAARWTARVSFAFFALGFAAPAVHRLFGTRTTAVLAERESALLSGFVAAHVVHLAALAVHVLRAGYDLDPIRLAGGVLGYAMAASLVLFPRIRTAALYYLWFAFLMTYLPRVRGVLPAAGGAPWTFGVFLALVVVLPFLRLAARLRPAAGLPVLASR